MAHYIEFRGDLQAEVERAGKTTTCQYRVGEQCPAQVRCYVVRVQGHNFEVADIELEPGLLRCIPCSYFRFIDAMD